MLPLAVSKSTEKYFWKHEGGCASKEAIPWQHTEQRCDMLSFLPLESRLIDEPTEEGADALPGVLRVQPLQTFGTEERMRRALSWRWFSSQWLDWDFAGGKGYVYLYYTKADASPLGHTRTFMAVQFKRSFPTSPHSWLILATSLSPN